MSPKQEIMSHIMTITHDISIAGIQTVTGLPFKQKSIEIKACINGSSVFSLGSCAYGAGAATQSCQYASDNYLRFADVEKSIRIALNAGINQATGYIQNLTNSSLEILWSKESGSSAGTAIIILSIGGHY